MRTIACKLVNQYERILHILCSALKLALQCFDFILLLLKPLLQVLRVDEEVLEKILLLEDINFFI